MDDNALPNDVTECHRLLLAAFKQSVQLEQQLDDARQQAEREAAESAQQVAELERVLDETAATRLLFAKYLVRLGQGRGWSLSAVVRTPTPAGSSISRDVDRRHSRHRAGWRGRKFVTVHGKELVHR